MNENQIIQRRLPIIRRRLPIIRRRLPPELLAEIHKCLPLADAINVLVNVPTRAIYQNNSPRMRRTIQRIKTSLGEYVESLNKDSKNGKHKHDDDGEEEEEDEEEKDDRVLIDNDVKWKPEFDTLLRYGALIPIQALWMKWNKYIFEMPKNFIGELFLHLANSRWPQMMIQSVLINFQQRGKAALPIPKFLQPLLSKKKYRGIGDRITYGSLELKMDDGQILEIYDGELEEDGEDELHLIVANKVDRKTWFEISIRLDDENKLIWFLAISQWKLESPDDVAKFVTKVDWSNDKYKNDQVKQIGDKLEATKKISWDLKLDMFLCRGAAFTQFRYFKFKIDEYYHFNLRPSHEYARFLFGYICNTKNPEEFLESIDMNFLPKPNRSALFNIAFLKDFDKGMPKGGKCINFHEEKLHILSAKTAENKLEFTLANIPTNGEYLFDVAAEFTKTKKIIGIKIQKRKNGDKIEMKCQHRIAQKRKADDDEPRPRKYLCKLMRRQH